MGHYIFYDEYFIVQLFCRVYFVAGYFVAGRFVAGRFIARLFCWITGRPRWYPGTQGRRGRDGVFRKIENFGKKK